MDLYGRLTRDGPFMRRGMHEYEIINEEEEAFLNQRMDFSLIDSQEEPSSTTHLPEVPSPAATVSSNISATATPSILQLPDEVLMMILGFLDSPTREEGERGIIRGPTKPELCAIALSCTKLARMARDLMFRDVRLATGHVSSFFTTFSTARLRNFIRTCTADQHTINKIRTLQLQADFGTTPDWGITKDDTVADTVLQVVSHSLTMEHLSILLPGARFLRWLPSLSPNTPNATTFTRVQSLYLNCGASAIPPQVFSAICRLPALKQIETPSPVATTWGSITTATINGVASPNSFLPAVNTTHLTSGVETILSSGMLSSSTELQQLIFWMPKLKVLVASLAGNAITFDDHMKPRHEWNWSDHSRPFSPLFQRGLLLPVAHRLQSLTITNPRVLVQDHDASLLDLSDFKNLEHLQISIHHICPASIRDRRKLAQSNPKICKPRDDFYHLLPPNLETLEIHYDSDQGIFYDPHHLYIAYNIETDPRQVGLPIHFSKSRVLEIMYKELWTDRISMVYGTDSIRDRLTWLFRLAEVRESKFPRLESVTVRETYAREWTWKAFDLSREYPEVFSKLGVKMCVVIRLPRHFVPPAKEI